MQGNNVIRRQQGRSRDTEPLRFCSERKDQRLQVADLLSVSRAVTKELFFFLLHALEQSLRANMSGLFIRKRSHISVEFTASRTGRNAPVSGPFRHPLDNSMGSVDGLGVS